MLGGREPKVVNGPELADPYYGVSESKLRQLFREAREYEDRGDRSGLHVIIMDELDSMAQRRYSRGNDHGGDRMVNQLLTLMEGIKTHDNVLVFGLTNRRDVIDSALLRPGRFGMHVEALLPNKQGRQKILDIHTAGMRKGGYLGADVDLGKVADLTVAYSGAELAGICRSAISHALSRNLDLRIGKQDGEAVSPGGEGPGPRPLAEPDIRVTWDDFSRALHEVKPLTKEARGATSGTSAARA